MSEVSQAPIAGCGDIAEFLGKDREKGKMWVYRQIKAGRLPVGYQRGSQCYFDPILAEEQKREWAKENQARAIEENKARNEAMKAARDKQEATA